MKCDICNGNGFYRKEQPNKVIVTDSGNGNSLRHEERVSPVITVCTCELGQAMCPKCWNAGYTKAWPDMFPIPCDCNIGKSLCPKCCGRGIIRIKNPEGARNTYHDKNCSDCDKGKGLEADRIATAERASKQRRETLWEESQIPRLFKSFTLDSSPYLKGKEPLKQIMAVQSDTEDKDFDWEEWGKSWYIHGPVGVGKTGVAVGICREHIELEDTVLFKSVPKLLKQIKSTWGSETEGEDGSEQAILHKCASVDVLVLDDICAEYAKVGKDGESWVRTELYEIINERHDEEKAIIFTSNCSLKELGRILGVRLESRIREMCGPKHIIKLNGLDLRETEKKGE